MRLDFLQNRRSNIVQPGLAGGISYEVPMVWEAPLAYKGFTLFPPMYARQRKRYLLTHTDVKQITDGRLFDPQASVLIGVGLFEMSRRVTSAWWCKSVQARPIGIPYSPSGSRLTEPGYRQF